MSVGSGAMARGLAGIQTRGGGEKKGSRSDRAREAHAQPQVPCRRHRVGVRVESGVVEV